MWLCCLWFFFVFVSSVVFVLLCVFLGSLMNFKKNEEIFFLVECCLIVKQLMRNIKLYVFYISIWIIRVGHELKGLIQI